LSFRCTERPSFEGAEILIVGEHSGIDSKVFVSFRPSQFYLLSLAHNFADKIPCLIAPLRPCKPLLALAYCKVNGAHDQLRTFLHALSPAHEERYSHLMHRSNIDGTSSALSDGNSRTVQNLVVANHAPQCLKTVQIGARRVAVGHRLTGASVLTGLSTDIVDAFFIDIPRMWIVNPRAPVSAACLNAVEHPRAAHRRPQHDPFQRPPNLREQIKPGVLRLAAERRKSNHQLFLGQHTRSTPW
jgi:hypothetical protein